MKISVIVPVYNTVHYLPRCIDSILSQSFTDFELLLIDDGSIDGSGQICDAYAEKDNRIRVFHKENGGVSSARNVGLDNAKGEWITFIDSDDWVEKDYFSIRFEDGIDLYVQNWRYADGTIIDRYEQCVVGKSAYCQFLKDNIHTDTFRTAYCFFFRHKLLNDNNVRFDSRFKLGEDTLFVMDYYRFARSIRIMDNSCYIYNRQDNWGAKYCLSFNEAIEYLDVYMDKYELLPCESMKLLTFMFSFIQKRIMIGDNNVSTKWALSKPVLRYKKKQLPNRGIKFKLKYYLSIVVAAFVNV